MTRATRAVFAATAILTLSLSGCDDEPTCAVSTVISGGYQGAIDWRLAGRDSCGISNPETIDPTGSVFAFVDRSTSLNQYIYVAPATPLPTVGTYDARVLFIVGDKYWDSGVRSCSIQIVEFEREDWSVIDFLQIRGAVSCPDPLVSPSAELEDISMAPLAFNAHLHDERIPFDFL